MDFFRESERSVSLGLELHTGYVERSNYLDKAGRLNAKLQVTQFFQSVQVHLEEFQSDVCCEFCTRNSQETNSDEDHSIQEQNA